MEDIKIHKFVCYILNCLNTTKQFIYTDKYYETKPGDSVVLKDYKTLNSIDSISDFDVSNDSKIVTLAKMKPYINVQYVPDYVVKSDNTLDIKQSIYQIFNVLKTSFDAKRWYINVNFTSNKLSQQNTVQLTNQFIGGADSYNEFLQSVIDAFIALLNGSVAENTSDLIMYVLSKINYYIAKQYVKLAFNKISETEKIETKPIDRSELNKLKVYDGEYEDNDYQQYYQKEILNTMNIYVDKVQNKTDKDNYDLCSELFKQGNIHTVKLFNTIKSFLKKSSTQIYQTPITTYTYNPTNIRPLIYKRASETDLSNFATQIVSDAFLNKNKLPAIYDFKDVKPIIMMGGDSDVNNSSNVYKAIYVKILNMLNAKKITLNKADKEAVENKLNQLEQLEKELKEELGNYAKYASVSHDKYETIDYQKVKQFLNDYEDKIRKYNSESAKIVRFIGKLTPYLY